MIYLTEENLSQLLIGSSFLSTGGGFSIFEQKKVITKAIEKNKRIAIKTIDEFKGNDHLISVYSVGDPSMKKNDEIETIVKAVREYEHMLNVKIKGIIPGEIGGECVAFEVGSYLNLPIVDSDLVGGRAAPGMEMDSFSISKTPLAPIYGISFRNKKMFLSGNFSSSEIENIFRKFFQKNGGDGIIIGYPISASKYKKIGMQGTISLSMKIGECLLAGDLEKGLKEVEGKILGREILKKATIESGSDFLKGWLSFSHGYRIWVKNENIMLLHNGVQIVSAPDLIVLINERGASIFNPDIANMVGEKVTIVAVPAMGYWNKKENRILWKSAYA